MRFYDIDGDREVALEQVAAALRPLLAPADVAALDAAKQRAELQLADARQEIWAMRVAGGRLRTEVRAARLQGDTDDATIRGLKEELKNASAERDRLAAELAYARQKITWRSDPVADLAVAERQRLDAALLTEALAERDTLRSELAAMTTDRDEWREERQRMARRLGRIELALNEGVECD